MQDESSDHMPDEERDVAPQVEETTGPTWRTTFIVIVIGVMVAGFFLGS